MELNENQLLETLKAGQITAFEMLFRTYYQPLCSYAYTFVQDKDEAEEIVQSTFISLWEKKETLEIRTAVRPYLYAMVRNACLNVLKHEKVKKEHAAVQLAMGERSSDSVARMVMASELETRIYEAMDTLPEQCRLVFKLSRFEELKYSEIAEHLNISIKTVENHMGKALKLMREQLREYLPLLIILMNGFLN